MRELKLRAWDTGTNHWLEGITYMLHTSGRLITIPPHIELMQFTGLKDENGKDIYEGDIIQIMHPFSKHIASVVWEKAQPMYVWMVGETWMLHFFNGPAIGQNAPLYPYCQPGNGAEVTILGNIYENPDLLTKENNHAS